ncbi:Fusaric acid resistance protein-like-domain-containing protein [Panaeolus papilionaceus]|nr:Fusaric acid resistance protein-like-domain-containing protein [Panaeolus papilionaceus]
MYSSPINIPTSSASQDFIFQSPQQVDSHSPRYHNALVDPNATASTPLQTGDSDNLGPTFIENPSTPTQSNFGSQILRTPLSFISRRRVPASPDSTSSFASRTQRDATNQQRWTLFGQMMENEGFIPTSSSPVSRRQVDNDYFNLPPPSRLSGQQVLSPDEQPRADLPSLGSFATVTGLSSPHSTGYNEQTSFTPPISVALPRSHPQLLSRITHLFSFSLITRNTLKCSIAYFIASLFTFSPLLSQLVSDWMPYGPSDPTTPLPIGHMIATIAVYYNPAKTVGSMIEADLFCVFGLVYAAFVALFCTSVLWWLEQIPGWEWVGDVVAILIIGISMGVLAWLKIWMENPSFNTACSMTAIIMFVVIVKEGGLETLIQTSVIILCGATISNIICYLVWPQSAISNLQLNMKKTLDSFSTLLPMLTRTFLLENDQGFHMEKIQIAVDDHQNSFTGLRKSLKEAKNEWILTGTGGVNNHPGRRAYEDAVECLNRLAQHLNGLRSGTRLQHDLVKAGISNDSNKMRKGKQHAHDAAPHDDTEALAAAASVFSELVDELGPPLRALSSTSTRTLNRLRDACSYSTYEPSRLSEVISLNEFAELIDGIEAALVRFESTSNHAVLRLYRRVDTNFDTDPTSNYGSLFSTGSQPSSNPSHETIFLVYFFIFTLQEFARELASLVDAIERVYNYEQHRLLKGRWLSRLLRLCRKSFGVMHYLSKTSRQIHRPGLLRKRLSYVILPQRRVHPSFPKIRPHAPNTIQTPPRNQLDFKGKIYQSIWEFSKRLNERDIKYAIKAGMATAILASPAFIAAARPTFVAYYGDWALISFFVVISPTIGATNYLSAQRVLGTLFGAAVAIGLYTIFPEQAVVLAVAGFLFSLPCFWFAVAKPQFMSASRFVLLTYNLTCLYSYNLREKDLAVFDIGTKRAIAVAAGVLWAAFISRFWWPSEARRELSKCLSEFCLNIGWLYTRLVASNSFAPEYQELPEDGLLDSTPPSTRLSNSVQEFMAMELHLQIKLIELQNLLAQAQHEPRLKGPFPVELYRQILTSLQTILDKMHSMRCVTMREEWNTSVRHDFILPVNRERREMVGNIMLSLATLAASFRLKTPLPPYLPPVEKTRLKLVEAIRRLDIVKSGDVKVSRQLLFFAYALTMKGVTMELELLGRTLQEAFGVIGQSPAEFEMLFQPLRETQHTLEHVA